MTASQPEIFYILNGRWPTIKAYGIQVAQTCQALAAIGARVTLIVPRRRNYAVHEGRDWKAIYGIPGDFSVRYLWSPDWVASGFLGKILFALQQTMFALRAGVFLLFRPGIVYSRDPFTLMVCSVVPRRLYWELHHWPSHDALFRFLARRMQGVVAITRAIKDRLVAAGYPAARILVAPDGVDLVPFSNLPNRLQARQQVHTDLYTPMVLYAGHLYDWKGADVLAEAAATVDAQIIFVGGSESDLASFKARHARLGNIRMEGHKSHHEIPLWLRAADVLVLPNRRDGSMSEFYTSPLKMFEYMASGAPIVASDLPSIREVLNESNAVLVEPDNPEALAQGILSLLTDPSRAARLAQQARRDVGHYTWAARAQAILSFLK